jgi:hypothetical protein
MFEKASRLKLRFDSAKGQLTPEDLWDLPLTSSVGKANLDDVARALHKQLKSGDDVSFVDAAKKSDSTIQLKFDLVKHVIDVRMAEAEARRNQNAVADKKQRIMQIIAEREDDTLKSASVDDLKKMLEAM